MQSLILRWPWWLAALVGAILPLSQLLPWLFTGGDILFFWAEAVTTPAARTVMADILWAAGVFSAYICVQAWHHGNLKLLWALLATWTLGLSCGLPLFMALRKST